MYNLSVFEEKDLKYIKNLYYMQPILSKLEDMIEKEVVDWRKAFDKIHDIMQNSKDEVEKILEGRKKKGEIRDIKQALKSIAGNVFSNTLIYIFLMNKIQGNIKPYIYITSKKSRVKGFEDFATIKVGDEYQKPDVDIIIYKQKEEKVEKIIILSLKTSLRERAGQTYKWKLLLEIATDESSQVKQKYDIDYGVSEMPIICFATVNFYNEINNPQHRGMFKFFDKAFIAKEIKSDFISPLSEIVDFVNENLG